MMVINLSGCLMGSSWGQGCEWGVFVNEQQGTTGVKDNDTLNIIVRHFLRLEKLKIVKYVEMF